MIVNRVVIGCFRMGYRACCPVYVIHDREEEFSMCNSCKGNQITGVLKHAGRWIRVKGREEIDIRGPSL